MPEGAGHFLALAGAPGGLFTLTRGVSVFCHREAVFFIEARGLFRWGLSSSRI